VSPPVRKALDCVKTETDSHVEIPWTKGNRAPFREGPENSILRFIIDNILSADDIYPSPGERD
jgi:hypothetical protein